MELRPELMPPVLDAHLVAQLAKIAARLDGARPGQWQDDLAEFNRLAGTDIRFEEFQGLYGGEEHEQYVRRILFRRFLTPAPSVSVPELAEIVSRLEACGPEDAYYLELFVISCKHPGGTDLIYWPDLVPELPKDREPTAEEIAQVALEGRVRANTDLH